ncbi:MAG TPA: glycerophosphodiester phosphodiesterase family protein [Rhodothermia bacterium]|nr:glycerophosphodiester phosphodiesterase family protein [Rhodothermia bacterium]
MCRQAGILCLTLPAIGCGWLGIAEAPATRSPVVIAHRGASAAAPEHTVAAYDRAVEVGADYIELDVRRTKDGALVVIHDAALERTARGPSADCTGPVGDKALAQIESCDAGSWFNAAYPGLAHGDFVGLRVPRVADVLTRYGSVTKLYVETKDPELYAGLEADLVALLKKHGINVGGSGSPSVYIQSFSKASLLRVRALDSNLPLVQLFDAIGGSAIVAQLAEVRSYASAIGVRKEDITAALVESAHASCLLVHAYVSDDQREMQSLLTMGVDGIITDRPDQLRAAIDGRPDIQAGGSGCAVGAR